MAADGGAAWPRDPVERRRRPEREARALARLDGLDWCPPLGPYQALGFAFSVRVMEPDLAAYLERALRGLRGGPGGSTYSIVDQGPASRRLHSLYLDGLRIVRTEVPSLALSYLLWHVNRSVVRESGRYLLIHASSAAADGRAVVLPAAAGSGKTTLVAGLVRRGLAYVTDEATAIDPVTGLVHPYPKPLSLDAGSWTVHADLEPAVPDGARHLLAGQWHVSPDALGRHPVAGVTRPVVVVSPRYVVDAPTVVEPVSRAQGLLLLAQNSFNFNDHGAAGLDLLARVVRGCRSFTLVSGSLDEACDAVLALL